MIKIYDLDMRLQAIPDAVSPHFGHTHTILVDGVPYTTSSDGGHVHALTSDHRHEVTLEPHWHNMEHTHQIPAHTHEIEYGIFEAAPPSSVALNVDGNEVAGNELNGDHIDLVNYLSKDSAGKINRGWHEIKITPDKLGRIVASLNTQIFIQSRGGGDY